MKEGTILTQRQAEYISSVESACIATLGFARMAIEEYPRNDEKEILEYFKENHDRMMGYLNGIYSLMDCSVNILESREF